MDAWDRTLLERVNPVYNTAKTTLFQLALSGDADAAALVDRLGLTFEGTQGTRTTEASVRLAQANAVFLETRFRTMQAMAEETGCTTIVDIPCGFTPRGLKCARSSLNYVGLDLPATIAELEPEVMALVPEADRRLIRYAAVDATNQTSLELALEGVSGPICVTCEGLLMYLNDSEAAAFAEGVNILLMRHGGCWICSDPEMISINLKIMRSVVGSGYREAFEESRRAHEERADIRVEAPVLMLPPGQSAEAAAARAIDFLATHGLRVERLAVASHMPKVESLAALGPDIEAEVRRAMVDCAYWKCTPMRGASRTGRSRQGIEFDVSCEVFGDLLRMSVAGRLDTLTAPSVLDLFERRAAEAGLSRVELDVYDMTYISSAGIRVLLIMCKRCAGGVTLLGVCPEVQAILEQTGVTDFLTLS